MQSPGTHVGCREVGSGMSIYEQLGVRTIINGVGPATRLGGTLMEPEVLAAMNEAARAFVKMDELQDAAGRAIREITGAEAGYVTSGAAAALALATAACITGVDPVKINRLPDTQGMRNEVIILRAHRYDYDHAIRSVGAQLVEVGFPDLTFPYELETAITDRTAAIAYYPVRSRPGLPLVDVLHIAHRHDVPVIVDAALEVPPVQNLQAYVRLGADLVAFSGGKAIGGPQASGFVCGRADLIEAVALHHQDMDVRPQTWTYRAKMESGHLQGPPHHGIGRSMKVGKEEVVGLIAALRRYVRLDHVALRSGWLEKLSRIQKELRNTHGLHVTIVEAPPSGMDVPYAVVKLDEVVLGVTAYQLLARLQECDPPICLNEELAWQGAVAISPMTLRDNEEVIIARAIARAVSSGTR
ncbi:MAG TPA: aminotransferase class V-fold PLP-dependent enzyme [bacterium]|nr:aminotransferase class V-fold PLP-dependent enzyme [bacterium]